MYIGTPAEREALFGADVEAQLDALVPGVRERLAALVDGGGAVRVVEALRDGVVLNSFERSANADYLAVLRPRTDAAGRLVAVAAALGHVGKPYDYGFDFATDGALVCSELVAKSYADVEGVDLMPAVVSGRLLLPTNLIAQKYAQEADTAQQQLDLVVFVDSSMQRGEAWIADEKTFRDSWQRPKWDVLAE